jgi:phage major head subunit gpT-like protein
MANIIFSEGSNLANSIYGKSQEPIKMFIEKRAEAFEANSIEKQIFSHQPSTHWAEKFTSMTSMNGFQPVGENGAYPVDGFQEGYSKTLENVTWKNSFAISREMIDDANIMDLRKKPDSFITAYYRTREEFAAFLIGSAFGASSAKFKGQKFDLTSADGQALFATAHPSKVKGGTQCNKFSNTFSDSILGAVETAMQNVKGDNGEILDVSPDTIIIPNIYSLKNDVFAAIGADKEPTTANNAYNYVYGRWNVIVWPYLNQYVTSGNAPWILFDSKYNDTYGGAVWLDRVKLEVKSEIAANDANEWKGYARYTAGFNDWRAFAVGGISGATDITA